MSTSQSGFGFPTWIEPLRKDYLRAFSGCQCYFCLKYNLLLVKRTVCEQALRQRVDFGVTVCDDILVAAVAFEEAGPEHER
jgi:hypothetical protein